MTAPNEADVCRYKSDGVSHVIFTLNEAALTCSGFTASSEWDGSTRLSLSVMYRQHERSTIFETRGLCR